jgi:hypothetical protein
MRLRSCAFNAVLADALIRRKQCEKMVRFLDSLDEEYGLLSSANIEEAENLWQQLHGSSSE